MKNIFTLLLIVFSVKSFAQKSDTIKLSEFKLCELTIDYLKKIDPNLKKTEVEEMDLCSDGFVQDARFENKIGYESEIFPGVIFQKYRSESPSIGKIHLTKEFKGYLPDGNFIDMKTLKASDILKKYDSLNTWTSRGCSDFYGIVDHKKLYFYVKINKDKKPQYPVDVEYYSEQLIDGIDIVADCYSYYQQNQKHEQSKKPLIILEGKEVTEDSIKNLQPEKVESVNVYKDKSAIDKYGEKGKNGVIEIFLKKKK